MNKSKQTQNTGRLAFSKLDLKEQLEKGYQINIFEIIETKYIYINIYHKEIPRNHTNKTDRFELY